MKIRLFVLCLALLLCLAQPGLALTIDALGLEATSETTVLDFDAAGLRITDAEALGRVLNQLPQVTEVRMYDSRMAKADMEWLFDSYPQVFFGFTLRFGPHRVRTDATAFSTLHPSEFDEGDRDYTHNELELKQLRMCTRLKALDIGHNTMRNVDFLSGLTELRVLIIGPDYYLNDFTPLASLTKLEYLEAFSTDVTDVSPLAGLTALRDLNLAWSRELTDLSPLYELPSLERFWGKKIDITEEERLLMEQHHPQCEFDWENNPTGGTWRLHTRYDVIYEMFQTGEYIPFDP